MDLLGYNFNSYQYPPEHYSTVPEIEKLSRERIKLYVIMESATNMDYKTNSKQWDKYVEQEIVKNKLETYRILLNREESCVGMITARRNDVIAHWMLSLCYCQNDSLRNFFIASELRWFIMLFRRRKKEDIINVIRDLKYSPVPREEQQSLRPKLITCRNMSEQTFENMTYYKTNFTEIPNLVSFRKVFLHKGFAYFPDSDIIFCLMYRLAKQFARQLCWNNKMIPTLIKEVRLKDLLANMPVFLPVRRVLGETEISLENIDKVASMHYPLCMKTIHNALRKDHHLKYDCKMQYGLFLKWLGLPYDDSMTFWKDEFTKGITSDVFDRKYSYLFKHQYGLVGSRIQYNPFSCDRILDFSPAPLQHHGCPFKHWDSERLAEQFKKDGWNSAVIEDVQESVRNEKYREACTKYFCVKHQVVRDEVFDSPNQYCEESIRLEKYLDEYIDSIFEDCELQEYHVK